MDNLQSPLHQRISSLQVPWRFRGGPCSAVVGANRGCPYSVEVPLVKGPVVSGKYVADDVRSTTRVDVEGNNVPPLLSESLADAAGPRKEFQEPHLLEPRQ